MLNAVYIPPSCVGRICTDKRVARSLCNSRAFCYHLYVVKIAEIAHGLHFSYDTKLVAMATSLEESEKLGRIEQIHANALPFDEKIMKIGPVDPEIALLTLKKEINASKIIYRL